MFGIFIQGRRGMHWVGNEKTHAQAQARVDAGDFHHEDTDFVLIIEGVTLALDVDGAREVVCDAG